MKLKKTVHNLMSWYDENKRDLPWRATKDPYKIWISETMLQQTTSRAVIPFYHRFLSVFPDVNTLAQASEGDVLSQWAGLGYYSRARNLHKAAKSIADMGSFPQQAEELLQLPGFGPYTSRAVASIAFDQPVGVVDGNTIRVMSRLHAWGGEWWKTAGRNFIQQSVDQWAAAGSPSQVNQALMELGASICSPTKPSCLLCPIKKTCRGFIENLELESFPSKKPKKSSEFWLWQPIVAKKNGKIALIKNEKLPFLKGQWILPGEGRKLKAKPKIYDYTHSITHHKIYVKIEVCKKLTSKDVQWVKPSELTKLCPVSLVQKALHDF